jgi:acetyl esterase/lipase
MASDAMKYVINMINNLGLKYDPDTNYLVLRELTDRMSGNMPPAPGVSFATYTMNGVEVELSTPDKILAEDIIFYIHGGGMMCGNARTSRGYASLLAAETGLQVYAISYRLAPENKFPAAPDDCFSVYKALLETHPQSKIALIGDSGGANLSIVTALMAKDSGIVLPASVTAYSAVTDMTGVLPSHINGGATDRMVSAGMDEKFKEIYFPDTNANHPYISPMYGNLKGFPPIKLVADKGETFSDDSIYFAEKAKVAGVDVRLQMWEGTFHAFPPTGKGTPEGAQVLVETIEFMREHFGK